MTLNQIQIFITTVKYKSISKASEALYISQPTLSRNITAMENELDVTLFLRKNNGVELTVAGELFYNTAVIIDQEYGKLVHSLKDYSHGRKSNYSITMMAGSFPFLAKLAEIFKQNNPDLEIILHENEEDDILSSIDNFSVDAGFLWHDLVPSSGYSVMPVIPAEIKLITALDSPLVEFNEINLSQAENQAFIIPTHPAVRKFLFNLCSNAGFTPKNVINVALNTTMFELVQQGKGVAFIYHLPFNTYENIHVIHLKNMPKSSLDLVMNERNLSPLAKKFSCFLRNINQLDLHFKVIS